MLDLGILHSLDRDYCQLIQQINAMYLRHFTTAKIAPLINRAEKPKFAVGAVARLKRRSLSFLSEMTHISRLCHSGGDRGQRDTGYITVLHPFLTPPYQTR